MSAVETSIEGVTCVSLPELVALRARAGKPVAHAARMRTAAAGGHVSALRGRGMDYAESRVYQAGDDARNIDWRRTARSGKWHTKLFEAEREQGVWLLVDTHATMQFGTRARYKSVAAARAAAWLAWTAVRAGDRVGALAFGPVQATVAAHASSRGALTVLGGVAGWDAAARDRVDGAREPLSVALARARCAIAPGSRVWLLSDGWCVDGAAAAALAKLARHVDLRVVLVVDALERDVVQAGVCTFATPSQQQSVDLARAATRAQFRAQLSRGWRGLAAVCDGAGVAWATLATSDEPDTALLPMLRNRKHRG